ncbi:hypothetical protein XAB3213_570006 [Xanthomonas citri pv. bilvae]|nr:hypothetical protein XAB3213_570006 [Xanthomonas citri pv. bilvae]
MRTARSEPECTRGTCRFRARPRPPGDCAVVLLAALNRFRFALQFKPSGEGESTAEQLSAGASLQSPSPSGRGVGLRVRLRRSRSVRRPQARRCR